jgi:hypothetical protein
VKDHIRLSLIVGLTVEDGSEKRREEQKNYREEFIASSGFAARSGAFLFEISVASRVINHVKSEHQIWEARQPSPKLISWQHQSPLQLEQWKILEYPLES